MELDWVPASVDLDRPSVARMYDYYLGGSHNFAVDREAAKSVEALFPGMSGAARASRSFLRRSVRYLIGRGIDQFLDLGSGIPTVGNVHAIAQNENPFAKVVYVDLEPVAVAHSTALLARNPLAVAMQGDLREPEAVLNSSEVARMLDLNRPVGVLMAASLHFVPDEDKPLDVVARYRAAMAPGSYLVICHGTLDGVSKSGRETNERVEEIYRRTDSPLVLRSPAEVAEFFTGFDVVEPGVVPLSQWRSDSDDAFTTAYVGVGRKP